MPRLLAKNLKTPAAHRAPGRLCMAVVTREDVVETFLVQHVDRFRERVKKVGCGRIGEESVLVVGNHLVPTPEGFRKLRTLRRGKGLVAQRVERQSGR